MKPRTEGALTLCAGGSENLTRAYDAILNVYKYARNSYEAYRTLVEMYEGETDDQAKLMFFNGIRNLTLGRLFGANPTE